MNNISAVAWTITVLYFITTHGASIDRSDIETGELQLNEEQYHGLVDCDKNVLEVKRTDKHQYSAIQLVPYDLIIKPINDCWWRYRIFMAANIQKFKNWANSYCRNFIGCWCCPGGGFCVTFIVKPDFWHCFILDLPIYKDKIIPIFEPELELVPQ